MRISPIAFNYGIRQNVQNQKTASNPVSFGSGDDLSKEEIDALIIAAEEYENEGNDDKAFALMLQRFEAPDSQKMKKKRSDSYSVDTLPLNVKIRYGKDQETGESTTQNAEKEFFSLVEGILSKDGNISKTGSLKDDRKKAVERARNIYEQSIKLALEITPKKALENLEAELANKKGIVKRSPARYSNIEESPCTVDPGFTKKDFYGKMSYRDEDVALAVQDIEVLNSDGTRKEAYYIRYNGTDKSDNLESIIHVVFEADGKTLESREIKKYEIDKTKTGHHKCEYKVEYQLANRNRDRYSMELGFRYEDKDHSKITPIRFYINILDPSISKKYNVGLRYEYEMPWYDINHCKEIDATVPYKTYNDDAWKDFHFIAEHAGNTMDSVSTNYRRHIYDRRDDIPFSVKEISDKVYTSEELKEF